LVISYKLLGTREWFVIHHTNCGMELFTDEIMRDLLASSLKTATFDGKVWRDPDAGPGSTEGNRRLADDQGASESVTADVKRIRNHPLVPSDIPIYGYVYDVKTGRLVEVPEHSSGQGWIIHRDRMQDVTAWWRASRGKRGRACHHGR